MISCILHIISYTYKHYIVSCILYVHIIYYIILHIISYYIYSRTWRSRRRRGASSRRYIHILHYILYHIIYIYIYIRYILYIRAHGEAADAEGPVAGGAEPAQQRERLLDGRVAQREQVAHLLYIYIYIYMRCPARAGRSPARRML